MGLDRFSHDPAYGRESSGEDSVIVRRRAAGFFTVPGPIEEPQGRVSFSLMRPALAGGSGEYGNIRMRLRKAMTIAAMVAGGLGSGCSLSRPAAGLLPKFGLYFNQDGQTASLAYGRANSDDVSLMLACGKGSREVKVTNVAGTERADRLTLVSGPQRLEVPVKVRKDESGAYLAEARLPSSAPVLQSFRRSGAVAVSLGGAHYGLQATGDERSAVANFFAACDQG
jgi:hypothetical protein